MESFEKLVFLLFCWKSVSHQSPTKQLIPIDDTRHLLAHIRLVHQVVVLPILLATRVVTCLRFRHPPISRALARVHNVAL